MAIISKIRRNFWFVLILLGLSLAAFIMMDASSASNLGGGSSMSIAKVAGEKIDYREFQRVESNYYRNAGLDPYAKKQTVWDYFVEKTLVNQETAPLGIGVSDEELEELQFGAAPSEVIRRNWTDPQTGQLNLQQLNEIKTTLDNGDEINPTFASYWGEQKNQIVKEAKESKLLSLVDNSVYTPNWMVEESNNFDNAKVDFKYVKIPFDDIDGGSVTVSDEDISAFVKENAYKYEQDQETRVLSYVQLNVEASEADKQAIRAEVDSMAVSFRSAPNDSLFVTTNQGSYQDRFFKKDQLPEEIQEDVAAMNSGDVYGAYEMQGFYNALKLIEKRNIPDTVEARHILRSASATSPGSYVAAHAFADSLLSVLNRGAERFDSLAVRHSQDQGSAVKGGDLGKFTQGRMVAEFNDVCFITGTTRGYYKVQSQFGVHIIDIQDQIYSDNDPEYKVAIVGKAIVPSTETQETVEELATDLISKNRNYEDLKAAVDANSAVSLINTPPLKANDFEIASLGGGNTSRDIVKFAFNKSIDLGHVSPNIYEYTNLQHYYTEKYIVAALKEIIPAGLPTVDAIRSTVEAEVLNNKKAENLASTLNVSSLDAVASQYGSEVSTLTDIALSRQFIDGFGNEPKVLSTAYGLGELSTSKPIVGNSGVFVVQTLTKTAAAAPTDVSFLKTNMSRTTKSQVPFKIMESLKDNADIEDNRSTFF